MIHRRVFKENEIKLSRTRKTKIKEFFFKDYACTKK